MDDIEKSEELQQQAYDMLEEERWVKQECFKAYDTLMTYSNGLDDKLTIELIYKLIQDKKEDSEFLSKMILYKGK